MFLIYFMAILCVFHFPVSCSDIAGLPNCAQKDDTQRWVLVNTLDGKLSALDYNSQGKEVWSIDTGPGPMLSSNIDRLELSNNGHWVRIIPSLTGSLYKFNGDTIDAIPISADSLLTTSFRYLDDLVIAGGKEFRTYGVVLNSGKVMYECSLEGCFNKTDQANYEDLMLIERNTQTVRAVEPQSGTERWNFSVGQLNIQFPKGSCHSDLNGQTTEFDLKAVVPEGLLYAVGLSNQISWKKQFSAPIVNVWTWDGKNIGNVDLFSNKQYSWSINDNNISPAIYVGMHNKQLYIHESVRLQNMLISNNIKDKNAIMEVNSVSRIPWKPFPASSSALAVVDGHESNSDNEFENSSQIQTTALSVLYASEYVNGNGFYLYTSDAIDTKNSIQCENNVTEQTEDIDNVEGDSIDDTPVQVIIVSLWYWWKEVILIAITTALGFNLIINPSLFYRFSTVPWTRYDKVEEKTDEQISSNKDSLQTIPIPLFETRTYSESSDKGYISRFATDFVPVHCLGKGGFGTVYEARNIIDECSYAVKRITLPNKIHNRERVMREVKALAKLDHRNIVRYFQAWVESPPSDWIDNFNRIWNNDSFSEREDFAVTKSPLTKTNTSVVINLTQCDVFREPNCDIDRGNDKYSDSFIVFENPSEGDRSILPSKTKTYSQSESSIVSTNIIASTKDKSMDNLQQNKSNQSIVNSSERLFLYIQMQLCRRESLRDWLKDHTNRKCVQIRNIFEQIVSAVEYVHQKGLIHRDLKPSNIFFSMEGEVKIGDFGLVTGVEDRALSCTDDKKITKEDEETHTQAVGTQLYMSPEQLNGLNYNFKVDIYSLGVILFELLVPFYTAMERIKTLTDLRKNIFPKTFCKEFEHEYQLLVMMLSEIPEERPTTRDIQVMPLFADSPKNVL